ncbi:hypothetical protein [Wolbachia endosymbiont of Muscidifurax uniraptor]|uniref:hypothetical protein n=1 Tax=Wolbachia endosymbiont of Muscidifurax uniraptor TaxID=77037 RepID=UPI0001988D19|nr:MULTISPECIES: hypothetical protein [Wolbachia]EEH12168.1 hypothetical protein WUni_004960 [Wolbachia endosymbiont of Muscidifurax uniraptor]ONI56053.1 hypothetical protein N500_0864 [Wolbachia pipientis wUni]
MTEEMQQLQKPKFVKPTFEKLKIPQFQDRAQKVVDLTNDINTAEIDEKMMVNVVRFKVFYDNLVNNINEYNDSISSSIENDIINPLSTIIDNIGKETKEITESITKIKEDMPYFSLTQAEDIL